MKDHLTLRVKSAFAEIPAANEAASRWLAERKAPPAADYLANLAIEELATNCIKYGYDDSSEHIIEIELEISAAELVLTVTDDGHPFNPLDIPEPDTNLPAEELPIGGLGIHLLRKMSDRMEYARTDGRNRLTLSKSFGERQKMKLEFSTLPNGAGRIKLNCDLDMAGVAAVETRFFEHCAGTPPQVLVDLSGVGFIGSFGIRMLLQAIKTVSARGGRLILLNPTKLVDSALDISGLGPHVMRGGEAEATAGLLQSGK